MFYLYSMKITYYGHACFGVEVAGKHLLFDPFVKHNRLAKHIDVNSIPADYILLSHGHLDHVADVMDVVNRTGAMVISNFEVTEWFEKQGAKNNHPLNQGGRKDLGFARLKFVNAVHSSGLPDGSYGGNPGGFVVETAEGNFYYSGDTALTMDMQLIPMTSGKLNIALLPIGDNFTMGVEDAILASDFIKCDKIIGLHYDTFGYIKIDHAAAIEKFKARGKELILLNIGETLSV